MKFVVSRSTYCNLWRDFGFTCSVKHLGEGEDNTNHNVTCSPIFAGNDSSWRKLWWWVDFFVKGNRQMLLYSCKWQENKRLTSRLLPKTGRSQSNELWNTKQTKHIKIHQLRITNHVFPKRSAKMTDKTEKPKIPSTLAKHTVWNNEFCCKKVILNFLYNIDLRHP